MRPSQPGTAQPGVTTNAGGEVPTDATIDRVEAGRLLEWSARDRQKRLHGSRLVEPTSQSTSRFTEVVDLRLLGFLRPFEPLVAWLLRRQGGADLQRLKASGDGGQPTTIGGRITQPGAVVLQPHLLFMSFGVGVGLGL